MKITRNNALGAEVSDLDISALADADAARLKGWVYEHKLLVLREQRLSEVQYVAFAKRLGVPQVYLQANYHHPKHPEIFVSANVPDEQGRKFGVSGTGRYWHTDCSFQQEPLSLTMVSPRVLPASSRGTFYVDMENAYQRLPAKLAAWIDGKTAIHEAKWRYKVQASDIEKAVIDILKEASEIAPPVTHPAVIVHPVTKKKCLYINEGFTTGFVGESYESGRAILQDLFDRIYQPENIHFQDWRGGDILLWDNRPLVHKASETSRGEANVSFRIGVYDGLPFHEKAEEPRRHAAVGS